MLAKSVSGSCLRVKVSGSWCRHGCKTTSPTISKVEVLATKPEPVVPQRLRQPSSGSLSARWVPVRMALITGIGVEPVRRQAGKRGGARAPHLLLSQELRTGQWTHSLNLRGKTGCRHAAAGSTFMTTYTCSIVPASAIPQFLHQQHVTTLPRTLRFSPQRLRCCATAGALWTCSHDW